MDVVRIDHEADAEGDPGPPADGGSWRWLERAAPWVPITILVASATVAILLRVRVGGSGLSAVMWATALLTAGSVAARFPGHAVLALIFLVPVVPYFRFETWLGKLLLFVLTAGVLVGVSLSAKSSWSQLLRDRRRNLATPVLAFAGVLAVSVVVGPAPTKPVSRDGDGKHLDRKLPVQRLGRAPATEHTPDTAQWWLSHRSGLWLGAAGITGQREGRERSASRKRDCSRRFPSDQRLESGRRLRPGFRA